MIAKSDLLMTGRRDEMSDESKSVYMPYYELVRISLDAAQRIGSEIELHHGGLIKLFKEIDALNARIAELEAENETIISDYEERMDNLVNIGNETGRLLQAEIGYLNAQLDIKKLTTETLQLRIAELEAAQRWIPVSERLPKESGWYRVGAINVFYEGYTDEVYFDANKTKSGWQSSVRDEIYCWLDGVPELPKPPEVQE